MDESSKLDKMVIRVVLRGVEVEKFRALQTEFSLHDPIDVMKKLLSDYGRNVSGSSAATGKNPVGRPKSEWKAEAERIAAEVMTIKAEELYDYLVKIGFIEYVYAEVWENDQVWRQKQLYIRLTDDGRGLGVNSAKLCVEEQDLFAHADLPDEIRKMFKWKAANAKTI